MAESEIISHLTRMRDYARDNFFAHRNPGNLTPTQKTAFEYTDMALLLLFKAKQMELDAEQEMQALLAMENT